MSNLKLTGFAFALGLLSLGSASAGQMTTAAQQPPMVSVSARSAISASAPSAGLDEKAVPDGSRSYPMTSVSGQRNMHSTAVVYD